MNYIKHILEQNNILHLLKKMLVVLEKLPWMFWACSRALLMRLLRCSERIHHISMQFRVF